MVLLYYTLFCLSNNSFLLQRYTLLFQKIICLKNLISIQETRGLPLRSGISKTVIARSPKVFCFFLTREEREYQLKIKFVKTRFASEKRTIRQPLYNFSVSNALALFIDREITMVCKNFHTFATYFKRLHI